jgi:hypothetical protein
VSYAPASLVALAAYLEARGVDVLGIVGDARHVKGYHLGADRIYSSTGERDRDYSVQTARDRAGLSNAAAAIDLGLVNGSLAGLQALSRWLAAELEDPAPDLRDVRELIYSPDGVAIRRWDAVTGRTYVGGTGTGQGDDSHRRHSHLSYYRDSAGRDQVGPFRRYLEGVVMGISAIKIKGEDWTPAASSTGASNGVLRAAPDTGASIERRIPLGATIRSIFEVRTSAATDFDWRATRLDGVTFYMLRRDWSPLVAGGDPAVDGALEDWLAGVPCAGPGDCDDEVAAAIAADRALARIVYS